MCKLADKFKLHLKPWSMIHLLRRVSSDLVSTA